jgi:hypothetical protein
MDAVLAGIAYTGKEDFQIFVRKRTDRGTERLGAGGDDVADYQQLIDVKRELKAEEEHLANLEAMQMAIGEPSRGWGWSPEDAAKDFANVEDWDRIDTNRRVWLLEQSPAFAQKRDEELMKQLQIIKDEEDGLPLEDAQAQAATVPPALAGTLGLGGAPPDGAQPMPAPSPAPVPTGAVPIPAPAPAPAPMPAPAPAAAAPKTPRPRNPRAGQKSTLPYTKTPRPKTPKAKTSGSS